MKDQRLTTARISRTAIGIALYVALSMTIKIPFIGHISLDLGYIAFAVFCYLFGALDSAIMGAVGCVIVSLITSGWFPPGWFVGNAVIGLMCGKLYCEDNNARNVVVTITAVVIGIAVLKTFIECAMFNIPPLVKIPNNLVAAMVDAAAMSVGVLLAPTIKKRLPNRSEHGD